MTSCQSSKLGSNSRKRQTPLPSIGSPDLRRSRQRALSSAAANRVVSLVFQPGYKISSRSPQPGQRKFCSAFSNTVSQPMHRSCDIWTEFDFDEVCWVIRIEVRGRLTSANLLSTAQILIGPVDPVGARRIEYIEVDRILHGFSLVRHMGRNCQHLASIHYDLFAVDPKF